MTGDRIARVLSDPGPFASVYVEVSRDTDSGNRAAGLRAREAADELSAQGAPEAVIAPIRDALDEVVHLPSPVSRCLVASERGVLLDGLTRTQRGRSVISWDTLPDIAYWLADEAEAATVVVALLDHEGGDVTTFSSRTMEPLVEAEAGSPSPFENKVRGGGWSHFRLQRSTETVWARNADEVITEIGHQVNDQVDLLIIGGEPDMRHKVLQAEGDWRTEVIVLEHLRRDGNDPDRDEKLFREIDSTVRGRTLAHRLAAVHQLRDRMGQGRGAATGIADTTAAFVQGQVERLLLDPDAAAERTVDPADHPGIALGAVQTDQPQRADRLLISLAALTGAEIVITRARTLAGAPAAALLRW